MTSKMVTIKQAVNEFGLSQVWIRRMCLQGKVRSTKELIPGTKIERTLINYDDLVARAAGGHSQRTDGRNKFVIYMTPDELTDLQALLEGNGLDLPLRRANPPKSGEASGEAEELEDLI